MHFVFVSNLEPAACDPDFENVGLGGSDSALVLLARALARGGHRVEVFHAAPSCGTFHDVVYRHLSELDGARPCEVLVVVNGDAGEWVRVRAGRKLFWITEFIGPDWERTVLPEVDRIICLSPFHQQSLVPRGRRVDSEKLAVLDLGVVEEDYFDRPPHELPAKPGRRLLYCSMPDRGLEHLARLFPRVREQVPDAELAITSDFSLWGQPPGTERYRSLFYGMPGVRFFGRVPRCQLVALQRAARVMAYPCIGGERFSISAAECLAAGAVPVTTNDFGLRTTVGEAGVLVDGRPGEAAYDATFVASVVRLLGDEAAHHDLALAGRQRADQRFRWSAVAERFAEIARSPSVASTPASRLGGPGSTPGRAEGAEASTDRLAAQGVSRSQASANADRSAAASRPGSADGPSLSARPTLLTPRIPDAPAPLPAAYPSICVAIPVYNMAAYLRRAVLSALWQLEPRDELLVIDDASTDLEGYAELDPFRDRIRWLRNPVNRGLGYTRNRAIQETQAEWIKFLDADDVLAPFALNLIRRAEPPIAPHLHVVAGGCHRIVNNAHADYLFSTRESIEVIKQVNPLLTSATFLRRTALVDVGMYDERIDFEEDWDMWLRLHERFGLGCFAAVQVPVCYYWIHQTERNQKRRHATVEGLPVREYFRRRYHCTPVE